MEIKIVKERDNPFFKRKDLVLDLVHEGGSTPKKEDLKKELASKYKVDVSQVIVEYIMTKSGLNKSNAKVKILKEKPVVVEEKPVVVEEKTEAAEKKPEAAEEKLEAPPKPVEKPTEIEKKEKKIEKKAKKKEAGESEAQASKAE